MAADICGPLPSLIRLALGDKLAVLYAHIFHGLSVDPFTELDDGLCSAELGIVTLF